MYLVFTGMPGESYHQRVGSSLCWMCDVFQMLINSLVGWFCTSTLGLVLFKKFESSITLLDSKLKHGVESNWQLTLSCQTLQKTIITRITPHLQLLELKLGSASLLQLMLQSSDLSLQLIQGSLMDKKEKEKQNTLKQTSIPWWTKKKKKSKTHWNKQAN